MQRKFKVAVLGGDSHAGTILDMFQDALPNHPLVECADFEWTSYRFGFPACPAVGKQYILDRLTQYDFIFINPHHPIEGDIPAFWKMLDDLNLWKKVILYDIDDDANFHFQHFHKKCLLYLKRAWQKFFIEKLDASDLENMIPLDFPLFKWYLDVVPMDYYPKRDTAVTCTLPQLPIKTHFTTPRAVVVNTVKNTEWEPVDGWISQLTLFYSSGWVLSSAATSYRDSLNPPPPMINWWYIYMHMLRRTKVLFNAANQSAVGDHRTWEQFASGALVVTDEIRVPSPHLPEPGVHYIPFDLDNPEKTIKVVKELLKDHTERERIARAGLEHAIKYHHSDARVAYVMEEAVKRLNRG